MDATFDPNYTGPIDPREAFDIDPQEAREVYEELFQMLEQQEITHPRNLCRICGSETDHPTLCLTCNLAMAYGNI